MQHFVFELIKFKKLYKLVEIGEHDAQRIPQHSGWIYSRYLFYWI